MEQDSLGDVYQRLDAACTRPPLTPEDLIDSEGVPGIDALEREAGASSESVKRVRVLGEMVFAEQHAQWRQEFEAEVARIKGDDSLSERGASRLIEAAESELHRKVERSISDAERDAAAVVTSMAGRLQSDLVPLLHTSPPSEISRLEAAVREQSAAMSAAGLDDAQLERAVQALAEADDPRAIPMARVLATRDTLKGRVALGVIEGRGSQRRAREAGELLAKHPGLGKRIAEFRVARRQATKVARLGTFVRRAPSEAPILPTDYWS